MIVISSGLGQFAIGVPVVAFVLSMIINIWVQDTFDVSPPNSFFLSLMTILPYLGFKLLNFIFKKCNFVDREYKENGEAVLVPVKHSLFFIPLTYMPNVWLLVMLTISISVMTFGPPTPRPVKAPDFPNVAAPPYPPREEETSPNAD